MAVSVSPAVEGANASRRQSRVAVDHVDASRRASRQFADPAEASRRASRQFADPAEASRRASRQFKSVVGILPYTEPPPTEHHKSFVTMIRKSSWWYAKRCFVLALLLLSVSVIIISIYIFLGPARKWFTEPPESTTQFRFIPVYNRRGEDYADEDEPSPTGSPMNPPGTANGTSVVAEKPRTSTACERNATVEHCLLIAQSAARERPWYVCPTDGGPCRVAWTARERCLGPRGSRFRTRELCQQQCANNDGSCGEGPESCPCSGDYRELNYGHLQRGGCTRIPTGRCLADAGKGFAFQRDCRKRCQDSGANNSSTSDPPCDLEGFVTRPCSWEDKLYRFYYDVQRRSCLAWNDDVCEPDAFSSIQLCTEMCR